MRTFPTYSIIVTPGSAVTTVILTKTSFKQGYSRGAPHMLTRRTYKDDELAAGLSATLQDMKLIMAVDGNPFRDPPAPPAAPSGIPRGGS